MTQSTGTVHLVGAGPGAKGLLTLRAAELLAECDVLVYDYLVNPEFRHLCRRECEMIDVGKAPGRHSISQDEIMEIISAKAKLGQQVVRLKGGDPFVFGRGGEEQEALMGQGINVEIVPGVTAALGCAAHHGIPLTHRDFSSSITFLTGHENPEKKEPGIDFKAFAKTGGTLCIYMGVGQAQRISGDLIAGGLSAKTPVVIIRWGTLPHQQSWTTTLEELPSIVLEDGVKSPSLLIVGKAASHMVAPLDSQSRPLLGRRIVITRAREQAGRLREKLEALGAEVLELPLICVEPDANPKTLTEVFAEIAIYDWIVFTSTNGVRQFFDYFFRGFEDLRCLGPMRIAAIGEATADELHKLHLQVDILPDKANSESLAQAMMEKENLENLKILIITGSRNSPILSETLTLKGMAIVDELQVYRTSLADPTDTWEGCSLKADGADAILFTSSSTVESFSLHREKLLSADLPSPLYVSIGPKTTKSLCSSGFPVAGEASEASLDALIIELLDKLS
jgi:uroporphyrinogen III methyltransferase/synthase